MIHCHDNLQIALNSQRTLFWGLEAICEFETSASILFLSSSLVLGIIRRKVMDFIQIEIYSLKSPNYELFVVTSNVIVSNFLRCHWISMIEIYF